MCACLRAVHQLEPDLIVRSKFIGKVDSSSGLKNLRTYPDTLIVNEPFWH